MQDGIIVGIAIAVILVVMTVILMSKTPSKATLTVRDVAPETADHALTYNLQAYLYHLFELATCNVVEPLAAKSSHDTESVRIVTMDNVVTRAEIPMMFSRALQSRMNTRDEYVEVCAIPRHFIDRNCVCCDAVLTVDGLAIAVRGLLVNRKMAQSISWQTADHTYSVDFSPECTYQSRYAIMGSEVGINRPEDLRGIFNDVADQGCLPTDSALAVARALGAVKGERYSALYLYWMARVKVCGRDERDAYAVGIPELLEAMSQYGACREKLWPYNPTMFNKMPDDEAVAGASFENKWDMLHCDADVKCAIRARRPVAVDLLLDSRTWNNIDHVAVHANEGDPAYWRSVVICGYDDSEQVYTIQNTWNVTRGGFLKLPYSYLQCSELWRNAVAFRE